MEVKEIPFSTIRQIYFEIEGKYEIYFSKKYHFENFSFNGSRGDSTSLPVASSGQNPKIQPQLTEKSFTENEKSPKSCIISFDKSF